MSRSNRRRRTARVAVGLVSGALAVACQSSSSGSGDEASVILEDSNNYTSVTSLSPSTVSTIAQADLHICWDNITDDLQCHAVDPVEDIDNVILLRFKGLSTSEVEEKLASSQLSISDIDTDGFFQYNTDHESTCVNLSSFSRYGTDLIVDQDYQQGDDLVYALLFAHGTTPGVGTRSMLFLDPGASTEETEVNAESGCGILDFEADLASAEPVSIPADGPFTIDWRSLTRDGQGSPIPFESVDGLMLGYFEGTTLSELQSDIFNLELNATRVWDLKLDGGSSADLAQATERGTTDRFSGFDNTDGIWLLALLCSSCQSPAPVVLSVIEPSG